jgi:hypothetical protein
VTKKKKIFLFLSFVCSFLIIIITIYLTNWYFTPQIIIDLPDYGSFDVSMFCDTYTVGIDGNEIEVGDKNYDSEIWLGIYEPNHNIKATLNSKFNNRKVNEFCFSIIGPTLQDLGTNQIRGAFYIKAEKNYVFRKYVVFDDNFNVIERSIKTNCFAKKQNSNFYILEKFSKKVYK